MCNIELPNNKVQRKELQEHEKRTKMARAARIYYNRFGYRGYSYY